MTPDELRTLAGCLRAIRFTAWAVQLDAAAAAWEAEVADRLEDANAALELARDFKKRLEAAFDPNRMAAIIRALDGNHSLGAGALAEGICAALAGEKP